MDYQSKKKLIDLRRKGKIFTGSCIAKYLKKYNYESLGNIREHDVVMAGYPKSGNTWMQNLLAGVLYGIDTKHLPDSLTQELIPDLDYKVFFKRFQEGMCFKTHDYPAKEFKKVIHLVRDPRDVMASYFAMVTGRGKQISQEQLIIEKRELLFGSWSEHCAKWIENPYGASILLVKYEDLLADPVREMHNILNFMNLERDPELIERAVDGNSLHHMKRKEKEMGFDKRFIRPQNWKEGHTFVRSGKKGSGKTELNSKLLEYLIEECNVQMDHFGYSY